MDNTYAHPPTNDTALIHLPTADTSVVHAVTDELMRFMDAISDVHTEAERHATPDSPTYADVFTLLVPLTETLLELEPGELTAPMHVHVALLTSLPGIPEALAMQIAFGRKVGEQHALKIARLVARAAHRGLSVDQYVAELSAADAVPRDKLVRLFTGRARRAPSVDRITRGVALLRVTASVVPEHLRPPILCALGWLLWSRGNRPVALAYLAEASRIEPAHVLAYGLTTIIASTVPRWVQSPRPM